MKRPWKKDNVLSCLNTGSAIDFLKGTPEGKHLSKGFLGIGRSKTKKVQKALDCFMEVARTQYNFDIQRVQNTVSETVKQVALDMVKALLVGVQGSPKLSLKELSSNHISATLKKELDELDTKTKQIYEKVLQATCVHIQNHSQFLVMAINQIAVEEGIERAVLFTASFVLPATKTMIEEQPPDSLECEELWLPMQK